VWPLVEAICDVGSGLLLAIGIQLVIFPFFDLHPTILDSIHIAIIFTGISLIRSWLWRLFFRRYHDG
jgi:hypothetical protein